MPTTSTKGKPVLAGTDAFAPYTHINSAVNWAETFASVRNVADSTAMNALSGNDVWVGLTVYHTGGTYAGNFWVCSATSGSPASGTWSMLPIGIAIPRFEATFSTGSWPSVATTTYQTMGVTGSTPWTSTSTKGGMTFNATNGQVTVPLTGRYNIYGMTSWTPNANGGRLMTFLVNGTTVQRQINYGVSGAVDANVMLSIPTWQLTAGNTVAFQNWQSSGGNLAINNSSTPTKIIIEYVGP